MIITETILGALKKAVEKAGNPSKFAKLLPGIKQTTVRNWLLGITKTISDDNWRILEPYLHEYLSDIAMMHYLLDEIGPDQELGNLLVEWTSMRPDIKQKINLLTAEAADWSVDMHLLDEAGFNVLEGDTKEALLKKYGGIEGLRNACNMADDDGKEIYDEISKLAIKSAGGAAWLMSRFNSVDGVLEYLYNTGFFDGSSDFESKLKEKLQSLQPKKKPQRG